MIKWDREEFNCPGRIRTWTMDSRELSVLATAKRAGELAADVYALSRRGAALSRRGAKPVQKIFADTAKMAQMAMSWLP